MSTSSKPETIVIRDRRKPNQYTTDNVIAREWLPILRVGDAFFFYSVYLSMANKETESSWSSLRTLAKYLQCSADLIIRANRLLEICELIYIETGNPSASNEYFILDPPSLTSELRERICNRLDDIADQESSKNWQSWVRQVRKALKKYKSLPSIWRERREQRENKTAKAVKTPEKNREDQTSEQSPVCGTQTGSSRDTSRELVSHKQGTCETQAKQKQLSKDLGDLDLYMRTKTKCRHLGVASQVFDLLVERYSLTEIDRQLTWLPFRHARDPAALLVSAVQKDWSAPDQYELEQSQKIWREWLYGDTKKIDQNVRESSTEVNVAVSDTKSDELSVQMRTVWTQVLEELRLQMTRAAFDTWLTGSEIVRMHDEEVVIRVRDHYAAEWLRGRWIRPIRRTLKGVLGYPIEIRFEV
jgi:hypothetical protein